MTTPLLAHIRITYTNDEDGPKRAISPLSVQFYFRIQQMDRNCANFPTFGPNLLQNT